MKHFLDCDENFKDHLNDLTDGKLEADSIRNGNFIIDTLVPVKRQKVFQLSIDLFELFSDEFFKEEDVSIKIDIEKSIDIGSDGSSDLPSVSVLQEI